jgi:polysaccharide biosynthesis/export protein
MIKNMLKMAKVLGIMLWMGILVFALSAGAQAQESKPALPASDEGTSVYSGPAYLLGPGDIIDIGVWKDETLSKSLTILPDGKISFPLIGEIKAAGRTVPDLKKEIEQKIVRYAPDPIVSIEVRQVNSMLIYVIGRVNAPGRFSLNTNVNVLQALTMAGGVNAFAKRDKIKIFRQESGKTKIYRFKYDDVTEGTELDQNIVLQRGDVVVVP